MMEGADDHQTEVPQHHLIPAGEPEMVRTTAELEALMAHAREMGCFAYDTEFIGELTYYPRLCLIQVATAQRVALVDPLGPIDLTPLWEAVADAQVQKLVHAGFQDLEPVWRLLGRAPANVFDTQVAAGFARLPYPLALRRLLEDLVGVRLGKALTFTQWDHRPLSSRHCRYAADDVRYLPAAADELVRRLKALGHDDWAAQECAALCEPASFQSDPALQHQRVRGNETLSERGLAVLREIALLRDQLARTTDVPPRSLLKDEVLVRLARAPVETAEGLDEVRGLPRPVVRAHGPQILDALRRGAAAPPVRRAQSVREETTADRVRIDGLQALASSYCLARSIDPALVFTRGDVAAFYRLRREGRPAAATRLGGGWRAELLGAVLDRFMSGSSRIQLCWGEEGLCHEPQD